MSSRLRFALCSLAPLLIGASLASSAAASNSGGFDAPGSKAPIVELTREAWLASWSSFGNAWMLLDMVLVLLLALFLGALIAYHPSTRRRVSSLEHFEQPKTLLMYAVVAAVVALIVEVQPAMAFVIFGIGGLLRFRTDVGESKDTGRVILVTVVGLCCGLKIFVVGVPATLIGWLLIYVLERQVAGIIRVSGVSEQAMHDATKMYRSKISQAGLAILGEQTKFIKREFSFVVRSKPNLNRGELQQQFDQIAPELRGVVDWDL
jgi:uncharacterized membrane protein YhiD involved in acid resistance